MKLVELTLRALIQIIRARADIVWIHDLDLVLVPALAGGVLRRRRSRLIWDQHEYPPERALRKPLFLSWFRRSCRACDFVVHANRPRREEVLRLLDPSPGVEHVVIENLPSRSFADAARKALPKELSAWLKQRPYFVMIGGLNGDRCGAEVVDAVLRLQVAALVVVGYSDTKLWDRLQRSHGKLFGEWVFGQPNVPYLEVPQFLDSSVGSIVLYRMHNVNQRLCASNKLYEAVARGTPVLVGANPPLREIVQRVRCGYVLEDDGEDVTGVVAGMNDLIRNGLLYSRNARAAKTAVLWETQENVLKRLVARR